MLPIAASIRICKIGADVALRLYDHRILIPGRAKLKVDSACIEDIDWRSPRGLDRSLVTAQAGCDWLRHGRCVLITSTIGVGKTWLARALA